MWKIQQIVGGGDWYYLIKNNKVLDTFDPCNKVHMQKLSLIVYYLNN